MGNINEFYNSILNIRNVDKEENIIEIISSEKEKLLKQTNNLVGFCKYLASAIELRLRQNQIRTYLLDLNEIVFVDHVSLIAEYNYGGKLKRFLIDPTFIQFVKQENLKLIKLKNWPSDKINEPKMVLDFLEKGMTEIDDNLFNKYINAFSQSEVYLDLNKYLLERNLDSISNKKSL